MLEFFPSTNIRFLGRHKVWMMLSALLVVGSIVSLSVRFLNLGIDFTGGTLVELGFNAPVEADTVRGYLAGSQVSSAIVQNFGSPTDILVRVPHLQDVSANQVGDIVRDLIPDSEVRRVETVGPQVGRELAESGVLALLYALGGILLYVIIRFHWKFSVGAIAATVHDVLLTMGFFSVTGMEFDLPALAGVLAIVGYSVNDTIVVFDRIREKLRKVRKGDTVEVVNMSINETLSRTVMTSLMTLITVVALLFLGGETIHGFAVAMVVGIIIGTYSSIFVASATTLGLGLDRGDLAVVAKEGADALP